MEKELAKPLSTYPYTMDKMEVPCENNAFKQTITFLSYLDQWIAWLRIGCGDNFSSIWYRGFTFIKINFALFPGFIFFTIRLLWSPNPIANSPSDIWALYKLVSITYRYWIRGWIPMKMLAAFAQTETVRKYYCHRMKHCNAMLVWRNVHGILIRLYFATAGAKHDRRLFKSS